MKKAKKLTPEELSSFSGELALLLHAGTTIIDALNYMKEDYPSSEGVQILEQIQAGIMEGNMFFEALSHTGLFPVYFIEMIKLGEGTGNLDYILQKLSAYYSQQVSLKKTIKNAVAYPFCMVVLMLVIIILLLTKVLPLLNQVFARLGSELSGIAKYLLSVGNVLNSISAILLGALFIIILAVLVLLKTSAGQKKMLHILHTGKFTKGLFLDLAYCQFASSFSLLQKSGIDVFSGLDLLQQLLQNEVMTDKLKTCKEALLNNEYIYDAFATAGMFKPTQLHMLRIAFQSGNSDEELDRISVYYEEKVAEKIQTTLAMIEPTLVIIFSLIVGSILLSVMLPLISIMAQIG